MFIGVFVMRFAAILFLSLFMLSSCSIVRSAMVTTMDVITAPYHYIVDDEDDPMND